MARIINKVFLVAIAIAALLQSSTAQTTHVVGDALGWVVPPTSDAYTTWAANQTFRVGDILVFNFNSGRHDVAQVTKTAFDGCNTASPISMETNSPASISLTSAGENYYICTFTGHCAGGQKLAINVSAAAAPAPQPSSTPSSVSAPTPTPTPASTPTSAPTPTSTPRSAPTPTSAPTPASTPRSAPTPTSGTPPPPSSVATPPSTTAPTASSPTGVASPPPPGNSAKSVHTSGLSATFLAIVVGLLY